MSYPTFKEYTHYVESVKKLSCYVRKQTILVFSYINNISDIVFKKVRDAEKNKLSKYCAGFFVFPFAGAVGE